MRRILMCLFLAAIVSLSGCSGGSKQQEAEKAAVTAAEAWASFVDREQYAKSWEQHGQSWKNVVSKDQWLQLMEVQRKPFGKTISRELTSKEYRNNVPERPNAEFVITKFKTSFENRKSIIETITVTLDKDGQWRVVGYLLQPTDPADK